MEYSCHEVTGKEDTIYKKRKETSKFGTEEMEKDNVGERIFRTEWWPTCNGNVNKRHLFIVTLQYFVKYVQKDFIMYPYDYKN